MVYNGTPCLTVCSKQAVFFVSVLKSAPILGDIGQKEV